MGPYQQQPPGVNADPYSAAGPAGGGGQPPMPPSGGGKPPFLTAQPANLWGGADMSKAFVDRIEGDKAILLIGPNGEHTQEVHVSTLPPGTKEGSYVNLGSPSPYQPPTPAQAPPDPPQANRTPMPPGGMRL